MGKYLPGIAGLNNTRGGVRDGSQALWGSGWGGVGRTYLHPFYINELPVLILGAYGEAGRDSSLDRFIWNDQFGGLRVHCSIRLQPATYRQIARMVRGGGSLNSASPPLILPWNGHLTTGSVLTESRRYNSGGRSSQFC